MLQTPVPLSEPLLAHDVYVCLKRQIGALFATGEGGARGSEVEERHLPAIQEQLLLRNVKRFGEGLVFKAHRLAYHSTLGSGIIKKKTSRGWAPEMVVPLLREEATTFERRGNNLR